MKVEIAVDMSALQSLATRVAPAPVRAPVARAGQGAGARGRGGPGAGAAARPARRQQKTAEELDAEMSVSTKLESITNVTGVQGDRMNRLIVVHVFKPLGVAD